MWEEFLTKTLTFISLSLRLKSTSPPLDWIELNWPNDLWKMSLKLFTASCNTLCWIPHYRNFRLTKNAPFVRTDRVSELFNFFENTFYGLSDFSTDLGFEGSTPQFTRKDVGVNQYEFETLFIFWEARHVEKFRVALTVQTFHDDPWSGKTSPGTFG